MHFDDGILIEIGGQRDIDKGFAKSLLVGPGIQKDIAIEENGN